MGQVIENAIVPKNILKEKSKGCMWIIRVLFVFAFVSFAWIFFVSNSLGDAMYVIGHMFTGIASPTSYLKKGFTDIGMGKEELIKECLLILILAIYDYFSLSRDVIDRISKKKTIIRWIVYICFGLIVVFLSQKGVAAEFVYFQF